MTTDRQDKTKAYAFPFRDGYEPNLHWLLTKIQCLLKIIKNISRPTEVGPQGGKNGSQRLKANKALGLALGPSNLDWENTSCAHLGDHLQSWRVPVFPRNGRPSSTYRVETWTQLPGWGQAWGLKLERTRGPPPLLAWGSEAALPELPDRL